jgi:hypothetical protein
MPWKWVRIDPSSLAGVEVSQLRLKEPDEIHALLTQSVGSSSLLISAIAEEGS